MADLRVLLEKLDFKNVKTYIQSGNVVFKSSEENIPSIEKAIKDQILKQYGFEVPVLVKTPEELRSIFDDCPFSEDKKVNSYFTLFYSIISNEFIEIIGKVKYPNEEIVVTKNCIYFYSSTGYGKTKFNSNFFEKKLNVIATARNYKTMVKLIEMGI